MKNHEDHENLRSIIRYR